MAKKHVRGLGCTFDEGRAECASQLHQVSKVNEDVKTVVGQISQKREAATRYECDWAGTENFDVHELIDHSEAIQQQGFQEVCKKWLSQGALDMISSSTGIGRKSCKLNGCPNQ